MLCKRCMRCELGEEVAVLGLALEEFAKFYAISPGSSYKEKKT